MSRKAFITEYAKVAAAIDALPAMIIDPLMFFH
jgi:hypothetical protein